MDSSPFFCAFRGEMSKIVMRKAGNIFMGFGIKLSGSEDSILSLIARILFTFELE
jgi:hypothetical protein